MWRWIVNIIWRGTQLVHRREADGPNAIWQSDHTPLDILLIRPDGKAAKPWLTTVIDDYSRADTLPSQLPPTLIPFRL